MTTISTTVDSFVASQNANRGLPGEEVALDYNALTAAVPAGGNSVTGVSGITADGGTVALAGFGSVIFDGANSITASTSGAHNYAISISTSGVVTALDENTGHSETITGASYLVFNNAATTSGVFQSSYIIAGGNSAVVAALYNAGLGRQPDFAGLEYYENRVANGELSLQQVAANFIASPEFQAKYAAATLPGDNGGANDAAFVTALYHNILGRSPNSVELSYYTAGLHNGEAGAVVDSTNPVVWSRAQELINFSASNENQTDISGWLVNTSSGFTNAGFGLPGTVAAATVLNVAAGGTINAALIDTGTIPTVNGITYINVNGGSSAGGVTANLSSGLINSAQAGITIDLSDKFTTGDAYFVADTVVSAAAGGSTVVVGNPGGTAYLTGTNNHVIYSLFNTTGAAQLEVVHGFTTGDTVDLPHTYSTTSPTTLLLPTPSAGTTVSGNTYEAGTQTFTNTLLALNVGTVTDTSAASMAAAAAKVYTPATNGTITDTVFFYADGPDGTVIWSFHGNILTAANMTGGIDLVGVHANQITATSFSAFH